MMASMFSGVSGLRNHQTKMNVIGNNIANINTVGYKPGRVTFREALVQSYKGAGRPSSVSGGTNPIQLGLGMDVSTVDNLFQQGGLETTGQITDLAIQGSGFFVLSDGNGTYYTRAGAFGFDANSNMVDPATGMFVQGRMADSAGAIPVGSTLGNITLPFGQQDPARATNNIRFGNNLNSAATSSSAEISSSGLTNLHNIGTGNDSEVLASDGAGGTHNLLVEGNQATNSTFTGINATGGPILLTDTLSSLGVTDVANFILSRDNGTKVDPVQGLNIDSSVQDLINAINQIDGVSAELTDPVNGGELRITRDYAGAGASYNIEGSTAAVGDISNIIFGVAAGSTFQANNGIAHNLRCTDNFTPNVGTPRTTTLDIIFDQNTGLATGIDGLGGNLQVTTVSGTYLQAGSCIVETDDTVHETSITVYDSQGSRHNLHITFTKSADLNTWAWEASLPGNEVIAGGGNGFVEFNPDGSLLSFDYTGGASVLTINPNNGAETMMLNIDAGSVGGFDGITGFAAPHTATALGQDGYTVGILQKISIDKAGNISGIFSNGVSRVLAQLVLADFSNTAGLIKSGRSLYQVSANSGEPIVGIAGESISGEISSGALESSAVDIASEFTSMITAQRGFQANARVITTSDQLLDELVNLKR